MENKTAIYIRDLEGYTGIAKLYELSEDVPYGDTFDEMDPLRATHFVVVSGTYAMFSGDETYIFAANKDGDVLDWGELPGSFRGRIDHDEALRRMGFEPVYNGGWNGQEND